jgi:hypothetical protein
MMEAQQLMRPELKMFEPAEAGNLWSFGGEAVQAVYQVLVHVKLLGKTICCTARVQTRNLDTGLSSCIRIVKQTAVKAHCSLESGAVFHGVS